MSFVVTSEKFKLKNTHTHAHTYKLTNVMKTVVVSGRTDGEYRKRT